MSEAAQPFSTNEKILALCLYMAGCQFLGDDRPCINLYDAEILFRLGGGQRDGQTKEVTKPSRFNGMSLWDAAHLAWKEKAEGHVEFQFLLTQECHDLIKAYRDQREKMKESEGKGSDMAMEIMRSVSNGAMLPAEGILRLTCVAIKLRPEFLKLWETVVPLLHVPARGKSSTFETTATTRDRNGTVKVVPATGVRSPGYKRISLNASENLRKQMGI